MSTVACMPQVCHDCSDHCLVESTSLDWFAGCICGDHVSLETLNSAELPFKYASSSSYVTEGNWAKVSAGVVGGSGELAPASRETRMRISSHNS